MKRKLDYFYAVIIPNPVWERKKTTFAEKVEEHLLIVEQYHLPILHETIFMALHKSQIDPDINKLNMDGLPECHDSFRKTMGFQNGRYSKDWYIYWTNSNPVLSDYQTKRREERNKLKGDFENYRLIHQNEDSKWLKPCKYLDIRKVAMEFAIAQDGEEFKEKVEDGYYNYSIEIKEYENLSKVGIANYLEKRSQGIRHVGRRMKVKPLAEIVDENTTVIPTTRATMTEASYNCLYGYLKPTMVETTKGLGIRRNGKVSLKLFKDGENYYRDGNLFNSPSLPPEIRHLVKVIDDLENLAEIMKYPYFQELSKYFQGLVAQGTKNG